MSALYEVANEYAKLMAEDLPVDMIEDTIEGIEGEFTDKVEQLLAIIKNESADVAALKAESKNLADRAKAIQNRIDNTKAYIIKAMTTMDKKKLNAGIHSLTVRKGSQSVEIEDLTIIPPEFVEYETTIKPDKKLIAEKIKLGQVVDGAKLVTGEPSLIIK